MQRAKLQSKIQKETEGTTNGGGGGCIVVDTSQILRWGYCNDEFEKIFVGGLGVGARRRFGMRVPFAATRRFAARAAGESGFGRGGDLEIWDLLFTIEIATSLRSSQ